MTSVLWCRSIERFCRNLILINYCMILWSSETHELYYKSRKLEFHLFDGKSIHGNTYTAMRRSLYLRDGYNTVHSQVFRKVPHPRSNLDSRKRSKYKYHYSELLFVTGKLLYTSSNIRMTSCQSFKTVELCMSKLKSLGQFGQAVQNMSSLVKSFTSTETYVQQAVRRWLKSWKARPECSFTDLLLAVERGLVKKAEINNDGIVFDKGRTLFSEICSKLTRILKFRRLEKTSFTTPIQTFYTCTAGDREAVRLILDSLTTRRVQVFFSKSRGFIRTLTASGWIWLPVAFSVAVYGISSFLSDDAGNLYSSIVDPKKVRFCDIAGIDYAKSQITEMVEIIKNPSKYSALGARPPRGVMIIGPPGTGKTMLARAMASEAGLPFIYASGSDFVEVYAGRGASRIRNMFEKAKALAPSVLFIDEIDAVGKTRPQGRSKNGSSKWSNQEDSGNEEEYVQTLNALLSCMDGMSGSHDGVLVMAATNRYSVLDPALTRPGRFDRIVELAYPNTSERLEILDLYARKTGSVSPGVNLRQIAEDTAQLTPVDLELIVNEAAVRAVGHNRTMIEQDDFDVSVMNVLSRSNIGTENGEYDFTGSSAEKPPGR